MIEGFQSHNLRGLHVSPHWDFVGVRRMRVCPTPASPEQVHIGAHLRAISPRDKPWDVHKASAEHVSGVFLRDAALAKQGARMRQCSGVLHFGWRQAEEGAKLRLRRAQFCRVRVCPVCQWRRSLMWRARLYQALPSIIKANPQGRWLFLTLTVRNCYVPDLRETLQAMNKAWQRLLKRPEFAHVIGWLRTTEVTRGRDGSAHPHFHVLLLVKPGMLSKYYVSQSRWGELWQECMKLDYSPVVDIRSVRERPSRKGNTEDSFPVELPEGMSPGLARAIMEVAKYSTKDKDLLADDGWLICFAKQVRGLRFIAAGGVLKDVLQFDAETNDDLLLQTAEKVLEAETKLQFWWQTRERSYVLRKGAYAAPV